MKMKRFFAPDMATAIKLIRDTLGEDAVILSNKKCADGIEIIAGLEPQTAEPEPKIAAPKEIADSLSKQVKAQRVESAWMQDPVLADMQSELSVLRGLLQDQLAGLAWSNAERQNPGEAMVFRRLTDMGFTPDIAKQIAHLSAADLTGEPAWRQALNIVAERINVTHDDILSSGGVVALVGPTGVGKTTTVAKLAARFALQNGAERVGLITTDSYRIAAHEQLRTYGKLLGVPVRIATDTESMRAALRAFRDKELVLIDTAGMSQRDLRLHEQFSLLRGRNLPVKNYLVLSATNQRQVSDEAANMFRKADLAGTIITKLDECACLGSLLSVLIKHRLPVAYITDGQRVPEDMHVARSHNLISSAMTISQQYKEDKGIQAVANAYGGVSARID